MKKTMIAALALFFALGISLDVSAQSEGKKPSKADRATAMKTVKASTINTGSTLLDATNKSKTVATIEEADVVRRKPSKYERKAVMIRKDAME